MGTNGNNAAQSTMLFSVFESRHEAGLAPVHERGVKPVCVF
jgi:hypothetical protein